MTTAAATERYDRTVATLMGIPLMEFLRSEDTAYMASTAPRSGWEYGPSVGLRWWARQNFRQKWRRERVVR